MTSHIDPGDQTANRTWKRPKAPPVPTSDAPSIFDPTPAETVKAVGMATAEEHASVRWCELAYRAIVLVSGLLPDFTSDDIMAAIDKSGRDIIESERNPKALGSIMRKAALDGLIVKTGEVRNSVRASLHASPRQVWRKTTTAEYRTRQPIQP